MLYRKKMLNNKKSAKDQKAIVCLSICLSVSWGFSFIYAFFPYKRFLVVFSVYLMLDLRKSYYSMVFVLSCHLWWLTTSMQHTLMFVVCSFFVISSPAFLWFSLVSMFPCVNANINLWRFFLNFSLSLCHL